MNLPLEDIAEEDQEAAAVEGSWSVADNDSTCGHRHNVTVSDATVDEYNKATTSQQTSDNSRTATNNGRVGKALAFTAFLVATGLVSFSSFYFLNRSEEDDFDDSVSLHHGCMFSRGYFRRSHNLFIH